MEAVLKELVDNVKGNIPGYIGVSVTEIETGEALVSHSSVEDFDPGMASAFNVEIINAKRSTMTKIGLDENLNDIQFNLDSQIHTINLSPTGEYFIYLALNREKSNMAVTRKLMSKYTESLNNEL